MFSEFGRNNYGSWAEFLDVDGINAMKQADFLKNFITEHPGLTGLMLINLEPTIVIFDLVIFNTVFNITYVSCLFMQQI